MSAFVKSTWLLIPVLLLLHQDYWLWEEAELVWGFIPAGLFSHLCISILASVSWFLICMFHWPKLDSTPWAEGGSPPQQPGGLSSLERPTNPTPPAAGNTPGLSASQREGRSS